MSRAFFFFFQINKPTTVSVHHSQYQGLKFAIPITVKPLYLIRNNLHLTAVSASHETASNAS